jgi:cation diffusion facilitator CzcD-associated flavoprotein CzcO
MSTLQTAERGIATGLAAEFDAVVIGAGVSGLYQLYKLRGLGLKVRVFETGTGVGGTWYWNRYPGARFDSESWTYGYSFSRELLEEWSWGEHFASQPETERYLNYVADKFDLRRDIQFRSRVAAAHYQEKTHSWEVVLEDGRRYGARFLITAIGVLSAPTMPRIPGVGSFAGQACHTHYWPKEKVDFVGKRVGIIGTGATAVQTIQEIAKTVGHLTVFQRTPNWCAPLHNDRIGDDEMRRIRASYPEIFARCGGTPGCFIHAPDPRATHEVTPEEREAFWGKLYAEPGFGIWQGNFRDILTDREANRLISDFVARKIRQRVKDPAVAEKLIPKNHGFGTRRVPLETRYYEVYNQPNVKLVDINETPIERITPAGIKTSDTEYEFNILIYATGFDAITGSFDRIDISGIDGVSLKGKWTDGPQTYLGVLVEGFPNLLMVMGPHAGLGNFPRAAEYSVEWATGLIAFARERGLTRVEATPAGVAEWTEHVLATGEGLLMNEIDSWMTGVNRNVEGKQVRKIMRYSGGHPAFREHCDAVAADGYRKLALSSQSAETVATSRTSSAFSVNQSQVGDSPSARGVGAA